jgi:hypothetical protein
LATANAIVGRRRISMPPRSRGSTVPLGTEHYTIDDVASGRLRLYRHVAVD